MPNVNFSIPTALHGSGTCTVTDKEMTTKITIFWDVTPSSMEDHYRRFEKTCCLHLHDWATL
jgi:hypothetical protein